MNNLFICINFLQYMSMIYNNYKYLLLKNIGNKLYNIILNNKYIILDSFFNINFIIY
jgi:hypothetical protein